MSYSYITIIILYYDFTNSALNMNNNSTQPLALLESHISTESNKVFAFPFGNSSLPSIEATFD